MCPILPHVINLMLSDPFLTENCDRLLTLLQENASLLSLGKKKSAAKKCDKGRETNDELQDKTTGHFC